MVIKRKRNSNSNPTAPVPVPEIKSEEVTTPSSTTSSKLERRGRPRKFSESAEENPTEKPTKSSREQQAESFVTTGQEALTSSPLSQQSTQPQDTSTISELQSTHQVPVYIPRYVTKPSPIYYPQAELFLSTVPRQLHFTYFNQLSSSVLYFQKNDIWAEMNILERLYYKNKNQHKHARYFRKIEEVRRIILRFKEMQIGKLMNEFIGLFYGNNKKKIHQEKWEYVPSQEIALYVLNRGCCASNLMDKALKCYLDAYNNLHSLLCQTEFMSFALACLSILARLNMLTRVWITEMKGCCILLKGWIECFPREIQKIDINK